MPFRRVIGRPGSFDSKLEAAQPPHNCSELGILLRVHLRERNPSAGHATGTVMDMGQPYQILRWRPGEFAQFQREFEEVTERVWNNRLFLIPSRPLSGAIRREMVHPTLAGTMDSQPYVRCTLDIQVMQRVQSSHASIPVIRLDDTAANFRSYVTPQPGRDSGMLTDRDVWEEVDPADGPYYAAAHEVSHLLSLNHPGCHGNQAICYGPPRSPMRRRVTAAGSEVAANDARPWLQRIRQHTTHQHWQAITEDPSHDREFNQWLRHTFDPLEGAAPGGRR